MITFVRRPFHRVEPGGYRPSMTPTKPAHARPGTATPGTAPPPHDLEALMARAMAGDPDARGALYETHVDRLYRVAFRMTGDDEMAREYVQQAFARAFQHLHTFRGDASFATWLHRVTVNVTLSGLRAARRSREMEQELEDGMGALPRDSDPMLRQRISEALHSLPESYRSVVIMHDVEGFTHDEIGRTLDIPTGTSKARLSRARARLRPLLAGCALEYAMC